MGTGLSALGMYILVNKKPVQVFDVIEWSQSLYSQSRIVEQTNIGEVFVSTVFLGLDHRFGKGKPLLFETMIFGGDEDGFQERYTSWDLAYDGHHKACAMVLGVEYVTNENKNENKNQL